MRRRDIRIRVFRAIAIVFVCAFAATPSWADWVRDEVRLNLRTAPGSDRKIIATVATGDQVTVLEEGEEWMRVQIVDGREGWIPAGFLVKEPPAILRIEQQTTQLTQLQEKLQEATAETRQLRSSNETLATHNESLSTEKQELDTENHRLRAGARWPEWIAGASILIVGMLVGAILQSWTGRRSQSRIRL